MTLHWITVIPTPYQNSLFCTLAEEPAFELMVHFYHGGSASHPWTTNLTLGYPSRTFRRRFGLDWRLIREALRTRTTFFVIGGWNDPTVITIINILSIMRRPFAIWTDTPDLDLSRHVVKAKLRGWWLHRVFRHARYVMGTGKPALDALYIMGCPKKKLVNFPYWIKLDAYRSEIHPADEDNPVIFLSSGQLINAHKGYDLAIRAFGLVRQWTGRADFIYRIAGTGPDRENLAKLARSVGVDSQIEFVGWVEPDALPSFYQSGQVFLHPALFEPYGVVVMEAMASGLTVIGSDKTSAVADRIVHMCNGLIHRTNDVEHLAEQIMYVLTHRDILEPMGRAARRTAEEWPLSRALQIVRDLICV